MQSSGRTDPYTSVAIFEDRTNASPRKTFSNRDHLDFWSIPGSSEHAPESLTLSGNPNVSPRVLNNSNTVRLHGRLAVWRSNFAKPFETSVRVGGPYRAKRV